MSRELLVLPFGSGTKKQAAPALLALNSTALLRGVFVGLVLLMSHVFSYAALLLVVDVYFSRQKLIFTRSLAWIIPGVILAAGLEIASAIFSSTGLPAVPSAIVGTAVIVYALLAGAGTRTEAGKSMVIGFVLITVSANLLSYLAGYQGAGAYLTSSQSLMGSFIGVERRVFFFFSNGVNAYGTLLGAMLAAIALIAADRKTLPPIIGAMLCLVSIMMVDSRGAIAGFAVACGLTYLYFGTRRFNGVVVVSVIAPMMLFYNSDLLAALFSEVAREGADVSSGRFYYWSQIFSTFFANGAFVFFGAGLNGTSSLPVNIALVPAFSNYVIQGGILPGAHNVWLQLLVGGGVFKIALYLAIFLRIGQVMRRLGSIVPRYVVSFIYYIICVGVFESVLDYNRSEILFLLFFVFGLVVRQGWELPETPQSLGDRLV